MSFDICQLKRQQYLLVLDARDMLASFMVDGMPNAKTFEAAMLPLIDRVCRSRPKCVIRAYGAMVDASRGKSAEALSHFTKNCHRTGLICIVTLYPFLS
jgi:hypothetical protein